MQFAMGALLIYIVSLFFINNHPASMNWVIFIAASLGFTSLLLSRGMKDIN